MLGAATVVLGLAVHTRGHALLPPAARDVAGDALWAAMIVWAAAAAAPRAHPARRGLAAFAVCVAVECSQCYHRPALDRLRRTTLGHLALGSSFDPRDLAAYALGVAAAGAAERTLAARASAGRRRGTA